MDSNGIRRRDGRFDRFPGPKFRETPYVARLRPPYDD
jgi:hypothetical protein